MAERFQAVEAPTGGLTAALEYDLGAKLALGLDAEHDFDALFGQLENNDPQELSDASDTDSFHTAEYFQSAVDN